MTLLNKFTVLVLCLLLNVSHLLAKELTTAALEDCVQYTVVVLEGDIYNETRGIALAARSVFCSSDILELRSDPVFLLVKDKDNKPLVFGVFPGSSDESAPSASINASRSNPDLYERFTPKKGKPLFNAKMLGDSIPKPFRMLSWKEAAGDRYENPYFEESYYLIEFSSDSEPIDAIITDPRRKISVDPKELLYREGKVVRPDKIEAMYLLNKEGEQLLQFQVDQANADFLQRLQLGKKASFDLNALQLGGG